MVTLLDIPKDRDLAIRHVIFEHMEGLKDTIKEKYYDLVAYYVDEVLSKLDDYLDEIVDNFSPKGYKSILRRKIRRKLEALEEKIISHLDTLRDVLDRYKGVIPENKLDFAEHIALATYEYLNEMFNTLQKVHLLLATKGLKGLRKEGLI